MSLLVRDLRFAYGDMEVLRGIDLEVPAGRSGFLLGPSGCGKSTLLRCIAGLERSYQGRVEVEGEAMEDRPPHRRRIGMLFQEPALFPHLRAWQNVAFGLRYRGVPRAARREEALRWLEVVALTERADADVAKLSGGQRQRVALARTLAARPRAVLLDEPLSSLDAVLRKDLGVRIRDVLADAGVPALWVTHDPDEAHALGERVWRMHGGRVSRD